MSLKECSVDKHRSFMSFFLFLSDDCVISSFLIVRLPICLKSAQDCQNFNFVLTKKLQSFQLFKNVWDCQTYFRVPHRGTMITSFSVSFNLNFWSISSEFEKIISFFLN